ncbi:hypothetical protein [Haladaptatus sp. W1]|uniref:hypothetical protein n=1 Tax=Haladaptatus sp. W1 TaxID=1897478 RepID=UPI0020C80D9B|nr:hypothetical protein [Haladaptatus sp. W1]
MNKSPINLRPLLKVPKERNPKGIALFSMAYLNRYCETGREADKKESENLLRWLDRNRSPEYNDAAGWGYNFDWQNARKFFLPEYHPSIVVTVFVGRAFLQYYDATGERWALDTAKSAASFIRTHINQKRINGFDVFTYTPYDSFVLINTNALAAGFFHNLNNHIGSTELSNRVEELFEFVVDAQADTGGWYYSMPATESHLSHDNFHTGFVLESLYEYAMERPDGHPTWEAYQKGMEFYRRNLFDDDGAPRFEADQRYPYDAHASAQAILTFVQRGTDQDWEMARKVGQWSLENLLDSNGYFYRRIGRIFSDKTPYMRWSQAWMCYALSSFSFHSDRKE